MEMQPSGVPSFGLDLVLRSTDDKLNGTPLSSYRTKRTATVAHLSMHQHKFQLKTDLLDK